MYWLKNTAGKEKITEYQAARYIDGLRAGLENYIDISFDTISAYKGNAAMMHYEPSAEDEVELLPEGMLLVDSGGHYKEGTTDITRTFVLGEISEEEREMFTAVVIANLELANAMAAPEEISIFLPDSRCGRKRRITGAEPVMVSVIC